MTESRRLRLASDAIEAAIEALTTLPDSDDKQQLLGEARQCERIVRAWSQSPPTEGQRESLMKKVLDVHVRTARLRRLERGK